MKDAGSFIHHSKRDSIFINNIYNARMISYPGGVSFKSFSINHSIEHLEIISAIKVINYGDLTDTDEQFQAKEQQINFIVLKNQSKNYMLGASIAYQRSWIGPYVQTSLVYNAGLSKYVIKNRWILGIAIENYTRVINQYSNLDDSNTLGIRLSSQYNPTHIPTKVLIDYIYNYSRDDELVLGLDININRNLRILYGKSYYYDIQQSSQSIFSNFALGAEITSSILILNQIILLMIFIMLHLKLQIMKQW